VRNKLEDHGEVHDRGNGLECHQGGMGMRCFRAEAAWSGTQRWICFYLVRVRSTLDSSKVVAWRASKSAARCCRLLAGGGTRG
jgi:hypothetical protein